MIDLAEIEGAPVDGLSKGFPPDAGPVPLGRIGERGWNLLRDDFPLPLALLRDSALINNSAWMRRFLAAGSAEIAPHGKTTMSPQLFKRQLDDGAWAITLATASQAAVARRFGFPRVLLANQLVSRNAIYWVLNELRRDPEFDFYCLVDSLEGATLLAQTARAEAAGRPLQLLLEGGIAGGRTGCRTIEEALAVARAVARASPHLALRGIEGFEGIIAEEDDAASETRVRAFLDFLVDIGRACDAEGLFAEGPVILSAGGSRYYDLVVERFGPARFNRPIKLVLRSGCYLTSDSMMYSRAFERLLTRSPEFAGLGSGFRPALEVWAYLQSRPEPKRALLGLGKRDASYDAGLPVPQLWFRPGGHQAPEAVPPGHAVVAINDQHAFLDLPANSPLRVGDMVGLGISHPCLTFDKWQVIPVVDDAYNIVSAIRTFF